MANYSKGAQGVFHNSMYEHEDDIGEFSDHSADAFASVECTYCGEEVEIAIDPDGGDHQEYVEDCPVCCSPWNVDVRYSEDGSASVELTPADGD